MQRTKKTRHALIGATLTILAGMGIATAAAPGEQPLSPAYHALDDFVGEWNGSAVVYISPGLPPSTAKASQTDQKVGQFWVTSRLDTIYMGKPYSEVLMLGWDGKTDQATGSIFSSTDPTPRPVTGHFNERGGTWMLFHETLNSAGMVVNAKTKITIDPRFGKRTVQRYHVLDDNFESLALEVKSTRRVR